VIPTLSWSALYVANSAFSHPGALPDDCAGPAMHPAHDGLASEAALQGYRTWYSTPLMTPSSNPPRSR
jgi:hypothetical protein